MIWLLLGQCWKKFGNFLFHHLVALPGIETVKWFQPNFFQQEKSATKGGSPGIVVMVGDSCFKGCDFESRHRILDGLFSNLFVVKIVICDWKDENKWKRSRGRPVFKKIQQQCLFTFWDDNQCWGRKSRSRATLHW